MTSAAPGSQSPADDLLPATRRALARRVAAGQAEGRTPSLVGAVVRDGRQVWCGGRSMLDGHEPDGNTQYRIGSLTKMFVGVLVMRLRDEGRLDLADPLDRHLDAGLDVTIAQLLSHTAGLASETPAPWWERTPGELRPGLADILSPPPHPAGRMFHYSNPGFGLLGALVGLADAGMAGRTHCARRSWTRWAWPAPPCRRSGRTPAVTPSTRGPTSCSSSRLMARA